MDTDLIIDNEEIPDVTTTIPGAYANGSAAHHNGIVLAHANGSLPKLPKGDQRVETVVSTASAATAETPLERGTWSSKMDFMLSAIGYAIGFGNIWRFPHLCYINGGGAFLIPYFVMMIFLGMPLFYLELALGQYASVGPITIWRVCPLFKGLGYAMVAINSFVSIYYNVILALSLFYLFASFTSELPWSHCGNWWDHNCVENKYVQPTACNFSVPYNTSAANITNSSCYDNLTISDVVSRSPSEEYWRYYVLEQEDDINIGNIGNVRWHLMLCNLLGWIIVYLCIARGVKTSGKIVYFTSLFPYVVLFILFIRGVTLPGASVGIAYYLTPDFSRLSHVQVWQDAATQILFSLGPGFGSIITLSSYNKFNNSCNRDAVIITLVNCATSIFAGFVIFSVLGYLAEARNVPVDLVVDKGPGLAFIAYPEALALLPGAPFFSICFFFMLITLGLDSQFVGIESILTGIMDEFPLVARWKKTFLVIICFVLFLCGLPCVSQGGMFVIQLIDQFTSTFPLLIVTMLEAFVICWIYGFNRFRSDIELMIGHRPNYFWVTCWAFVTPLVIFFILVFACVEYNGVSYADFTYPRWAEGLGWMISSAILAFIPTLIILKLCQCIGTVQNLVWVLRRTASIKILNLSSSIKPEPSWGPALAENRRHIFGGEQAGSVPHTPTVTYHEGHCFITNSPLYTVEQSTQNESHI